ncbi:MAG: arylamine N-acetyltransferase, partial [Ktedonobacteraceae bacterium]|nr:arylamine N-acetyltransferase [Ktedonobacteraceae bacterium]
ELNGLFFLVLQHLGFSVTPLAARVFHGEVFMPESHRLTLVEIAGERWIADVGFGGNGLIEAIPLALGREFPQYLDTYRFIADPQLGFVLQHQLGDQWRNLYAFSLQERSPADYERMNHDASTSPDSHFNHHTICTIATHEARIILLNDELKIRRPDETITTHVEGKDAYWETLQHYFGVVLPPEASLQSPYSSFRVLS